jgi:hypothetical protein
VLTRSAVSLPQLIFMALGEVRQGSYTTWHIAAIGTLLAIVTIRKFAVLAWIALAITSLEVIEWGGPDVIFNSGSSRSTSFGRNRSGCILGSGLKFQERGGVSKEGTGH